MNNEIQYQISDMARLFKCTPGGIRYYEEVGLLKPARLPNGRRVYTQRDVSALFYLRQRLSMGMSIDAVKEHFHYDNYTSLEELSGFIKKEAENVLRMAHRYQRMADDLQYTADKMNRLYKSNGAFSPAKVKEYYYLVSDPLFGDTAVKQKQLSQWMDPMLSGKICTVFSVSDLKITKRSCGLDMDRAEADEAELPLRSEACILPGGDAWYMAYPVIGKDRYGLDDEDMADILDIIRRQLTWRSGLIISKIMYTHIHEGVRVKYYDVWLKDLD